MKDGRVGCVGGVRRERIKEDVVGGSGETALRDCLVKLQG